jgi:hypothetical protein
VPTFRAFGTPSLNSGAGPHVLAYPAGVVSGDLLLIQFRISSSTAPTTPSGWTKLFGPTKYAGTTIYGTVFYRVAGGSEPSSVSITKTSAASVAVMSAYSGCDPTTPVDVYATADLATSGTTYASPSVTTTKANTQVLRMYFPLCFSGAGTTPNASDTERYDTYDSWDGGVHELADRAQAAAGSAGASNATGPALNGGMAATIALAPVSPPPVADFTGTPTSGARPLSVAFTDLSTNSPTSWDWDFGDGSAHGTTQNPTHSYTAAGTYTVVLVATNAGGSNTKTRTGYVTVSNPSGTFTKIKWGDHLQVTDEGAGVIRVDYVP